MRTKDFAQFSKHNPLVIILVVIMLLIYILIISRVYSFFGKNVVLSPQSRTMVTRSESLESALLPGVWPPGYPLLLLTAHKLHFPIEYVNLALFLLTFPLIFIIFRWGWKNISPIWPMLLYSVSAFNFYNLAQYTSEALLVPLSMLLVLCLVAYLKANSFFLLCFIALCCSLLFVSRYQMVLWLMPIFLSNFIFLGSSSRKTIVKHTLVFCTIACIPIGIIGLRNYLETGYLTGIERFNWSSRRLPDAAAYFATSTSLCDNIRLTFKTYLIDFVSPITYATHEVNRLPLDISGIEVGIAILFALAIGIICFKIFSSIKSHGSLRRTFRDWIVNSPTTFVVTEFFIAYILTTILFWTIGNNDPIYTRFLYPSYIYFILVIFSGYSLVKKMEQTKTSKLLFQLLLLSLVLVNIYKVMYAIIVNETLPY
ncbi:MAG: hypothetical protein JXA33_28400 [Anaerolineae bacterium]|nr:hypothetical protein [Anaerolineae bacterium]